MRHLMAATVFVMLIMLSVSCAARNGVQPQQTADDDRAYQQLADQFVKGYLDWRPQQAVSLGLHEYDGRPADYAPPSLQAEHQRLRRFRDRLAAIDGDKLSANLSRERRVLLAAIDGELMSFEVARSYWKNPMTYAD